MRQIYRVSLEIVTDKANSNDTLGDPRNWDWNALIETEPNEDVLLLEVRQLKPKWVRTYKHIPLPPTKEAQDESS